MPAEARLIIFSGRRNPRWFLSDAEVARLRAALANLKPTRPVKRPSGGYRGIRVALPWESSMRERRVTLFGGVVTVDETAYLDPGRRLETALLVASPAPHEIGLTVPEIQAASILKAIDGITGPAAGIKCTSAPTFPSNVSVWDDLDNNCYSYANNARNTDSQFEGAQPGGGNTPALNAAALIAAAKGDNLVHLGKSLPGKCPTEAGAHYLAICLIRFSTGNTVKDYHCLRLDKSGTWSHKNGPDPVTNLDDHGDVMASLNTVRLVGRPKLVGFFKSVKNTRTIVFS